MDWALIEDGIITQVTRGTASVEHSFSFIPDGSKVVEFDAALNVTCGMLYDGETLSLPEPEIIK